MCLNYRFFFFSPLFFLFFLVSSVHSSDCPIPGSFTGGSGQEYSVSGSGCYLTADDALQACYDNELQYSCASLSCGVIPVSLPGCSILYDTYGVDPGDFSVSRDIGLYMSYGCDSEVSTLISECGGSGNVVWPDMPNCTGECLSVCEDRAAHECGEASVFWDDVENCSYHCEDPDECSAGAVAECGDLESVFWDNVETCKYHCDQGDCEDEYQTAKLECSNPRLISSASCEYSCDCSDAVPAAEAACPYDYFMNEDCTYDCKCCGDIFDDCIQACGGSDNVGFVTCDEDQDAEGKCTVTFASDCNCTVPPIREPEPEPEPGDPDPDPEKQPAPDPDDDPDNDKTCAELEAACSNDCQFSCSTNASTGKVTYHKCDCGEDPAGDPDDGANGWLKKIEDNTDKTAEGVEKSNKWLKAIKHNTDTQIKLDKDRNEDLDNVAENTRLSVKNQKAINATLQKGNALTEDGNDYLKIIAGKNFSSSSSVSVNFPEEITTEGTSEVVLGENIYSATFTEEEGFAPFPEEGAEGSFSKGLSDYIATGIPLISYIEGMSINLSSSSPVLNMMFWGRPVNVDFSAYVSVIDVVGNILFALSIISGFMLIIARIKS